MPYYRVGTVMRFAERWFTDVSFRFMNRGKDVGIGGDWMAAKG